MDSFESLKVTGKCLKCFFSFSTDDRFAYTCAEMGRFISPVEQFASFQSWISNIFAAFLRYSLWHGRLNLDKCLDYLISFYFNTSMTNLDLIFDPFDLAKIIIEDQSSNLESLKL